jgi:vesicle coat complex subunit
MNNRPRPAQLKVAKEDNILDDLNEIANICIGNETPQDASFNDRNTLPELLAYIMTYPMNQTMVKKTIVMMGNLSGLVDALLKKIKMMEYKNQLKSKKY